jgi:hypothetical protein
LKLRNAFLGIISLTLVAACGQSEPAQPADEPAADQTTDGDFPDLILPDNE